MTCKHPHLQASQVRLGDFMVDALQCVACGEAQPNMAQTQLVIAFQQARGQRMVGRVTTVGKNSLAIRMPIDLARAHHLAVGTEVEMTLEFPGVVSVELSEQARGIRRAHATIFGNASALLGESGTLRARHLRVADGGQSTSILVEGTLS